MLRKTTMKAIEYTIIAIIILLPHVVSRAAFSILDHLDIGVWWYAIPMLVTPLLVSIFPLWVLIQIAQEGMKRHDNKN